MYTVRPGRIIIDKDSGITLESDAAGAVTASFRHGRSVTLSETEFTAWYELAHNIIKYAEDGK